MADPLARWQGADVRPVWDRGDAYVLHAYLNACPESPDGHGVVVYVSAVADAHQGKPQAILATAGANRLRSNEA